ncbi:hypothetical protein U9M48_028642 [Paspalum notatum var. saurae]|uniref:Uncharacterized protein n=1 Tax=Paspalum notatum var. saurae TaxID=547442 RepID=A0AAQ3X190_PASNO
MARPRSNLGRRLLRPAASRRPLLLQVLSTTPSISDAASLWRDASLEQLPAAQKLLHVRRRPCSLLQLSTNIGACLVFDELSRPQAAA